MERLLRARRAKGPWRKQRGVISSLSGGVQGVRRKMGGCMRPKGRCEPWPLEEATAAAAGLAVPFVETHPAGRDRALADLQAPCAPCACRSAKMRLGQSHPREERQDACRQCWRNCTHHSVAREKIFRNSRSATILVHNVSRIFDMSFKH